MPLIEWQKSATKQITREHRRVEEIENYFFFHLKSLKVSIIRNLILCSHGLVSGEGENWSLVDDDVHEFISLMYDSFDVSFFHITNIV